MSLSKYLKILCRVCLKENNMKDETKLYGFLKMICTVTGFEFILKKILENEIFKSMFLNKGQLMCLSQIKKIGRNDILNDPVQKNVLKNHLGEIIKNNDSNCKDLSFISSSLLLNGSDSECLVKDYFFNLIKNQENLTNYDKSLFNYMSHQIKDEVSLKFLNEQINQK